MDDISSKAKEGLLKGIDFIKSRAQETVDIQKLGSRIRQLEQRREECILDLGHRVFVMFEMDRFDPQSLKDRVEEVRELNGQIEALQGEVAETREHFKQGVGQLVGSGEEGAAKAPEPATDAPPSTEQPEGATRLVEGEPEETPAGVTRVLEESDPVPPATATRVLEEEPESPEKTE